MTKEEIYEHLAKVYIGKKKKKKKKDNLLIKSLFFISLLFCISVFFFIVTGSNFSPKIGIQGKGELLSVMLGNYPLRLAYNFNKDNPQIQNFSMPLPNLDLRDFDSLIFSIRGFEGKIPRLLKIVLENKKKETSRFYFDNISSRWKKTVVPLSEFKEITDWSNIMKVSFVFEAWNIDSEKGKVLIDGVSFASKKRGN